MPQEKPNKNALSHNPCLLSFGRQLKKSKAKPPGCRNRGAQAGPPWERDVDMVSYLIPGWSKANPEVKPAGQKSRTAGRRHQIAAENKRASFCCVNRAQ